VSEPTADRQTTPEREIHRLRSTIVGDEFELSVARCGENPKVSLIVVDGDGLFGLAVDTVRLMQIPGLVPAMVVIGIGYPGAESILDTVSIRARDLTPSVVDAVPGSGGADAFADFIQIELLPWLRGLYRPDQGAAAKLVFFGHSLGGLFGTHLLLTRPGLFDQYIISSPSLWWDHHSVFEAERRAGEQRAAGLSGGAGGEPTGQVVFGIGALETDEGRRLEAANLPDGHRFKPPARRLDMVDDLERFVESLTARHHPGLDVHQMILPDEFHATVPGVVLSRGLRWLHRPTGMGEPVP
jgi:predicted alpha/beta superfamily hydrolase